MLFVIASDESAEEEEEFASPGDYEFLFVWNHKRYSFFPFE